MKMIINNYPKCECGNELVPIYAKAKDDKSLGEEKRIEIREDLFWKCPKCKKIVS